MPELPAELIYLAPLALAAGIDLYLTLLVLGAAPTAGLWDHALPGALGDLDPPGVLIMVGSFYILEFSAERFPPVGLLWNAFHAVIRPMAGALLALLLLDGAPLPIQLAGALAGGGIASLAHAVRSGGAIVRWLGSTAAPHALLISLLEDSIVLGLLVLTFDEPRWALGVSGALTLFAVAMSPSRARALGFAVRLATARAFKTLTLRRWRGPEELPPWIHHALEDDVLGPGRGLRGSPAGAYRLPGAPRFATGWVVIRGSSPFFVFRRGLLPGGSGGRARAIDLGSLPGERVSERGFFRRVDLAADGAPACVFFGLDGPSFESLESEFLLASEEA